MVWSIHYHTEAVESFVCELPAGLLARYLRLTDMMLEFGANLGMPHTPPKELKLARDRLAEVRKS